MSTGQKDIQQFAVCWKSLASHHLSVKGRHVTKGIRKACCDSVCERLPMSSERVPMSRRPGSLIKLGSVEGATSNNFRAVHNCGVAVTELSTNNQTKKQQTLRWCAAVHCWQCYRFDGTPVIGHRSQRPLSFSLYHGPRRGTPGCRCRSGRTGEHLHLLAGAEELFADRKPPRVSETWRQRAEFQGGILLIHKKSSI